MFLEAESFSSNGTIGLSSELLIVIPYYTKGVTLHYFNFERTDTVGRFYSSFEFNGTATMGLDYDSIVDSLVIPSGQLVDTIFINPILDSIVETTETVVLTVIYEECSGQLDTSSATIYISDYTLYRLSLIDSVNICDQIGEIALLKCNLTGGLEPISINWSNGSNSDSIISYLLKIRTYSISVYDNCNQEVHDSLFGFNAL